MPENRGAAGSGPRLDPRGDRKSTAQGPAPPQPVDVTVVAVSDPALSRSDDAGLEPRLGCRPLSWSVSCLRLRA